MGKNRRIKKEPQQITRAGQIVNTTDVDDPPLRFSFKYLDLRSNTKFCLDHCQDGYLEKLLMRLRDVCGFTVKEFRSNKDKSLRAHTHEWSRTTEPKGFSSLNSQLRAKEAWQFEITRDAHGRVHGILLDDTFYVVWLDPAHKLYGS